MRNLFRFQNLHRGENAGLRKGRKGQVILQLLSPRAIQYRGSGGVSRCRRLTLCGLHLQGVIKRVSFM